MVANAIFAQIVSIATQNAQIQTALALNLSNYTVIRLELEHLLLAVAQLLQSAIELALVLGANLTTANSLVHTRGTTDEELDVALLGFGENSLEEVLGDVALAAVPALGRVVEDIEGLEALGVGVFELVKLLSQEDVILGDVAEDKSNLGLVIGVLEDLARELVHWGDTGASGNQGDVVMLVGFPGVLGEGALEVKLVVDLQAVEVLGHGSVGVGLDDQFKVAGLIWLRSAWALSLSRLEEKDSYPHR